MGSEPPPSDPNPLAQIPVGDPAFAIDPAIADAPAASESRIPETARDPQPEAQPKVEAEPKAEPPRVETVKNLPARTSALEGFLEAIAWMVAAVAGFVPRAASFGLRFFLPYVLAASGFGSATWFARNPARLPDAITNKLTKQEQYSILVHCVGTLGALVVGTLVGVVVVRLVQKRFQVLRAVSFGSAWSYLLIGSSFGAILAIPQIESTHPIFTLQLIGMCAACAGVALYRGTPEPKPIDPAAGSEAPVGPTKERLSKAAVVALLVLGWAGYAIIFSRLAVLNHQGLVTRVTDLGIYDNIFWQSAHGHPLRCTFIKAEYHGSAHFDPLLVILSPLYLIYPRAEFILVLQSVWLGSSIVPMYLIGRGAGLGRAASLVLAFCFLLHPALHGANLYEFHSLTLANPVLLWVVHLLDRGRLRWYYPALAVCLLIREDMSLLVVFIAISAMLRYEGPRRRAAVMTLLVALVYFVVVKLVFMTSADVFSGGNEESYGFTYYYEHMTQSEAKGFAGFLLSIFTNPGFIAWHAFQEPKLQLMMTLLIPVAFLPLISRKGRFVLLYGAVFILLASRGPVFTVHFQYTAVVLPIVFALVPDALARLRTSPMLARHGWSTVRLGRAAIAATIVGTILVSLKFGGILENASFRGGFNRPVRKVSGEERKTFDWVEETIAKIPPDASVASSDKMGSHISNRARAYFYKVTVKAPGPPPRYTTAKHYDYVFLDDRDLRDPEATFFKQDLACGALEEVARRGNLVLMKTMPRGAGCTH